MRVDRTISICKRTCHVWAMLVMQHPSEKKAPEYHLSKNRISKAYSSLRNPWNRTRRITLHNCIILKRTRINLKGLQNGQYLHFIRVLNLDWFLEDHHHFAFEVTKRTTISHWPLLASQCTINIKL